MPGAGGFAAELEPLGIDPQRVTVSGISSGGYMAVQLGVAFSARFAGVAAIAAGPYGCARTDSRDPLANVRRALGPCMAGSYPRPQRWQCAWPWLADRCPGPNAPDPAAAIAQVHRKAARGAIDSPSHLARQRVFLLAGGRDTTVVPAVVEALRAFYAAFVPAAQLRFETLARAAHTFPTDGFDRGNACGVAEPPFVSDCGHDAAGALLAHLHGPLEPGGPPPRTARAFDQRPFFGARAAAGLADTGYVYVPAACEAASGCALHVALHGCRQTVADVGRAFIDGAGYNRWAEGNGIVVLYPQVRPAASALDVNPRNCWDWWGYTGAGWDDKDGLQLGAIVAMIERLTQAPARR